MSQRTRARTTGAATRKQPETSQPAPDSGIAATGLSADDLARTLRAVAAELERDPHLATRIADSLKADAPAVPVPAEFKPDVVRAPSARTFRPTLVTGASPSLGPGVPDPFALHEILGEVGLRETLADLRLGTLRAILREHRIDPAGKLSRLNDAGKLRDAICAAVLGRA